MFVLDLNEIALERKLSMVRFVLSFDKFSCVLMRSSFLFLNFGYESLLTTYFNYFLLSYKNEINLHLETLYIHPIPDETH